LKGGTDMTVCNENIKELVAIYSTEGLTANEQSSVEEHIKECEECRYEFDIYQSIEQELDLSKYKAPNSLHIDVMKRLSKHKNVTKYTQYQPYLSIAAAIVFVVFLGFVGLMNPNIQKTSSDEAVMVQDAVTEEADTGEANNEEAASAESYDMSITTFDVETEEALEGAPSEDAPSEDTPSDVAPRMAMEAQTKEPDKQESDHRQIIIIGLIFLSVFSGILIYRRAKKR